MSEVAEDVRVCKAKRLPQIVSTKALVCGVGNVDTTNTNDAHMVSMKNMTQLLVHGKHGLPTVPPVVQGDSLVP
jgi:hypothetical protein